MSFLESVGAGACMVVTAIAFWVFLVLLFNF